MEQAQLVYAKSTGLYSLYVHLFNENGAKEMTGLELDPLFVSAHEPFLQQNKGSGEGSLGRPSDESNLKSAARTSQQHPRTPFKLPGTTQANGI